MLFEEGFEVKVIILAPNKLLDVQILFEIKFIVHILGLYQKSNFQGRTALFENGRKYYDESGIKMMMDTYQKNKKEIDIVSVGWVL